MKKLFLSALVAFGLCTGAYAIPAMPGLLTFTQPDGTTVTVRQVGDENGHYFLSEDNYPLLTDAAGRLCYAEIGVDGKVRASAIQASNTARRAPSEKAIVAATDASALSEALIKQLREAAPAKPPQAGMGLHDTSFPHVGEVRSLVILVEYQNLGFTIDDPKDYFSRLLNEEGFSDYGATGSARDFYVASSNGIFTPVFDVVGPVVLPEKRSYYGGNDSWTGRDTHPEKMVIHACDMLDDTIDFSQYDTDNDGRIDNIYLFYAGVGENEQTSSESVWPHSGDVFAGFGERHKYDGVLLDHYACSNEWMNRYAAPDGIGSFCHEFGHVLGLPDLYDSYNQASGNGPHEWSAMAMGPYLNRSRTPPTFSAYERNALGWLDFDVLDGPASIELEHLLDCNFAYLVPTEKDTEFYLIENRQQKGWDAYLPHHGMVVWHVDYVKDVFNNNKVNNTASHQYVDIIEAGGDPEDNSSIPFPGSFNKTSFTSTTTPALKSWAGIAIDLPITNIQEQNGYISFDVCGGVTEIADPVRIAATAATPYAISLEWDAVAGASQYLLSVWKDNGDAAVIEYVDGYESRSVHGLAHVVTGLRPETLYHFSIKAKAGALVSSGAATGSATTPELTFEYMYAEALPATDVTENSFTARWKAMDGAADYEISFRAVVDGEIKESKADMGSGSFVNLPEGWSTNCSRAYTPASYCGNAAPSLGLDCDGGYLLTPLFSEDIKHIEFWYKGVQCETVNYAEVQFRASESDDWTTAETIMPIPLSANTFSADVPEGMRQARILYNQKGKGNIAVDDVVVRTQSLVTLPLEGYQKVLTGNVTSFDFKVEPEMNVRDEFYYSVAAVAADGRRSLPSEEVYVNLSDRSGVDNVAVGEDGAFSVQGMQICYTGRPNTMMSVFDASGCLVGTAMADSNGTAVFTVPAPGFYVAAAAGESAKALCR